MAARAKTSDLSLQIRKLLVEKGWTQQRLAAEMGITQGHLSKVMRGVVPGSTKIALMLDGVAAQATLRRAARPWLDLVAEAASRSRDAKIAMEAIARMSLKSKP